jgi:hypothetical protein
MHRFGRAVAIVSSKPGFEESGRFVMLDRNEDRDALRALANAIISWKFRHAHDVEGFREVDECLRRAEDVLRRAGYFGDAAPLGLEEDDASGIDI